MQYRIKYRLKSVLYDFELIKTAIYKVIKTRMHSILKIIQKIYFSFLSLS